MCALLINVLARERHGIKNEALFVRYPQPKRAFFARVRRGNK